jgi:hypothetical protein
MLNGPHLLGGQQLDAWCDSYDYRRKQQLDIVLEKVGKICKEN